MSSPWLFGDTHADFDMSRTLSVVAVGALVVICSVLRVSWPQKAVGLSGANIAFGVWTLTSARMFGYGIDTTRGFLSVRATPTPSSPLAGGTPSLQYLCRVQLCKVDLELT